MQSNPIIQLHVDKLPHLARFEQLTVVLDDQLNEKRSGQNMDIFVQSESGIRMTAVRLRIRTYKSNDLYEGALYVDKYFDILSRSFPISSLSQHTIT